jgi:hypothetical protein
MSADKTPRDPACQDVVDASSEVHTLGKGPGDGEPSSVDLETEVGEKGGGVAKPFVKGKAGAASIAVG